MTAPGPGSRSRIEQGAVMHQGRILQDELPMAYRGMISHRTGPGLGSAGSYPARYSSTTR